MLHFGPVVLLIFKLCSAISDDDYNMLPQVYEMDDYLTCNKEANVYCKTKLVLVPNNGRNKLWQVIEDIKKERRYMERDVIYRAKCIPKEYFAERAVPTFVTDIENRKLQNLSLHTKIQSINCKDDKQIVSVKSYLVLWLLVLYILIIIFSTILDVLSRKTHILDVRKHKFITILSILKNWEALTKPTTSLDYNKLRCLQGFRIFVVCVVIAGHTILTTVTTFSTNIRLLEDYSLSAFRRCVINLGFYMIQTSLLVSGWLHTIQIYKAVERSEDKKLTLNMIVKALLARYLRFMLPLMFYAGLQSTNFLQTCFPGPQTDFLEVDSTACRTYWWANLLLINNFLYVKNMCNFCSWYLSCDFQAHVISMALFYLMYRYNLGIKLFGITLLLVAVVNTYILYDAYAFYGVETGVTYVVRAEELKLDKVLENDLLYIHHTFPITNIGSYLVGIIFGAVYYQYKNTKIKVNKVITTIWILGHFGVVALAVGLTLYDFSSSLVSAVIGSLLKPMFSVGIAIGILGMSHNIGGYMKKLFESHHLEFISRWTFSVYIFHLPVIFYRSSTYTYMPELSYLLFVRIALIDIFLSFLLGLVLHLVVDKPLLNILFIINRKWTSRSKAK